MNIFAVCAYVLNVLKPRKGVFDDRENPCAFTSPTANEGLIQGVAPAAVLFEAGQSPHRLVRMHMPTYQADANIFARNSGTRACLQAGWHISAAHAAAPA
jgi:hypothetical protein